MNAPAYRLPNHHHDLAETDMRHRKLLPFAAASVLALGFLFTNRSRADAPPTLAAAWTTEADLRDPSRSAEIDRFWSEHGRDGQFTGRGDIRIAFRQFVKDDRAAERGAIVLVSGRTESMLKYKELVFDLWRSGYSVYVHDHRGQGLSGREAAVADEPEKGHVGRFDDYVDDLRQFVGTQVAVGGHRRVFLLAQSMGGAVSALFLEGGGPEVRMLDAAVLSSPMLEIMGAGGLPADVEACRVAEVEVGLGYAAEYLPGGGGYSPTLFASNRLTHSRLRYERQLEVGEQMPSTRLGDPTKGWVNQACGAASRARRQADLVRTPVMVLTAGADAVVHPDGARAFCSNLAQVAPASGCDGRGGGPVVIAGARHELLFEADAIRSQAMQAALGFFTAYAR